uniref:Uncharacterized protein n=1 Tax=Candidozyma auris TaxID=498019 RepID=A0A0L0NX68_CANAR
MAAKNCPNRELDISVIFLRRTFNHGYVKNMTKAREVLKIWGTFLTAGHE